MPTLTISIINWNSSELTRKCIESIFSTVQDVSCDVFVVDNNSCIEDKEQLKNIVHVFPGVNIVFNKKNIGYASAHNQVIRSTSSPYVLLLNPDSTLCSNTIDCMIYALQSEDDIGIAGAKVISPAGMFYPTVHRFPRIRDELLIMAQDYFYPFCFFFRQFPKDIFDIPSVEAEEGKQIINVEECIAGPFLLLRRKMLEDIGLLEEKFFLFSEENDLCLRASEQGWRRVYMPDNKVWHALGGARKKAPPGFSSYHQARSKLLFFKKHHGTLSMYLVAGIYSFFSGYSLIVSSVKNFFGFIFDREINNSYFISCQSILLAVRSVLVGKNANFPDTE